MTLKTVKGSLSRGEMKSLLGGASCTADCGVSCSGDVCQSSSTGVKCWKNNKKTETLCPASNNK